MKLKCGGHLLILLLLVHLASVNCWPIIAEVENELYSVIARDTHPVVSTTATNSTITARTIKLSRGVNTTFAGLSFLLTLGTYWFLMKYTTPLSNEIMLPSEFFEENIAALLSLTWPKHYINSPEQTVSKKYPRGVLWFLFYMRSAMKEESDDVSHSKTVYEALGSHDMKERPSHQPGRFMVRVKVFSPVMKNLVQIEIWNSVSFWLVLVMVVNTLIYNGFLSKNITNDSVLRLVLVIAYAIANFGHQSRTKVLIYRNFTTVLFQACWTVVCKNFMFVDAWWYEQSTIMYVGENTRYRDRLSPSAAPHMRFTSVDVDLLGTTERSDTYRVIGGFEKGNDFAHWPADDKRRDSYVKALLPEKTESKLEKFSKPLWEAEIKAYEKATESSLEKTLANVAVLLGICLATALTPWTSTQKIDATSVQLGSYALLVSISTGLFALISSITQLTNAAESARLLLEIQEKTITANQFLHEAEDASKRFTRLDVPEHSFSNGIAGMSRLTSCGLWRSTNLLGKLKCFLLGTALVLIPHFHQEQENTNPSPRNSLFFNVHGITFACSTTGYNLGEMFRANYVIEQIPNETPEQEPPSLQPEREKDESRTVPHQREIPEVLENSGDSDT